MTTKTQKESVVSGLSDLVRPRFGPGMLLQHDDLEQLSLYTRDLSRLLFRNLFGCGVVCGLAVEVVSDCKKWWVTVGKGVALDCDGDPVYVPQPQRLPIDESCDPKTGGPLWVILCGTEKCCAPRAPSCPSDEDDTPPVCTRERTGFEIRVVSKKPECLCACLEPDQGKQEKKDDCQCVNPDHPCYSDHYLGKCGCHCGEGSSCDCRCILLARLVSSNDDNNPWKEDHSVRRFIRPVLMRDPLVQAGTKQTYAYKKAEEKKERVAAAEQKAKVVKAKTAGRQGS